MRKSLTLMIALISYLTVSASTKIGDLYYNLNNNSRTAEVTYYSEYSDSNSGYVSGSLTIPSTVTSGSITYKVTSIGYKSFYNCKGLTSVTIPTSVTSIGTYAFRDCSGLTGSLTIPESVTSIGGSAFRDCSGFTGSLTIPNSVTSIDDWTFSGCSGFTGSLTIGNSVQSIGDWAFNGCFGFTGSLTIPNSVTSIGRDAFFGCSGFNGSLTIGNSVQPIGERAFQGCSGFTGTLTIPESVTSIGNSAFSGCKGFTGSLTIPESVTSIGGAAFWGCSGFNGSLTIPESVTVIDQSTFRDCSGFTSSLTIPESVTSIGSSAFYGCSGFTGSLTIPESVTSIGDSVFHGCSGFTGSLTIPESVTSIESGAFYGCSGFTDVESFSENPPTAGGLAFYGLYNKPLYVPENSVSLYKEASEWERFYSIKPFPVDATDIKLNRSTLTLLVGQEESLIAILTPENATREVVWSSENDKIVSVDQTGKLFALAVGTTIITAKTGNLAATCEVTVTPASPSSIELNIKDMVLFIGQSETLQAIVRPSNATNTTVTWLSDDESVATVSDTGKVTGLSEGSTFITARCGEVSATCKVTVNPIPASNIEITSGNLTLTIGSTTKLTAKVSPDNTTHPEVDWSSSDTGIATIAADGTVTAESLGTAIITAKCGNVSATCTVTVIPVPSEGIVISPSELTMLLGDEYALNATVYPENTTDKNVTWGSENPAVASVSSTGVVTALSLGTTNITARNGNSTANCQVTVKPVVATGISLNVKDETLFVASSTQLVATISPSNVTDKTITWTSSKPEIATVSDQGEVLGISVGSTTVTATIGNVSASAQINVVHRIPDMDPAVTTSDRDIVTISGRPVNMAVYAEGGEPSGWSYLWTKNGETVSKSSELNITAINETNTVIAETYRVKVENEIDKVVIFSEIFDFVVQIYPAVNENPDGTGAIDISITTGTDSPDKTREGNTITLSVDTPEGGYPQGWRFNWSDAQTAIGEGESVETVASMSAGSAMAIESTIYNLELTNYGPEGDVWAQFNLKSNPIAVYRRPQTPLQMLRKGDGTSHTFVTMMTLSDQELGKLGYEFIYGWTDADGNDHIIEQTKERYCHTEAKVYDDPTNKFWVYAIWVYNDGSMVSSGLRYLDGSVDEDFDASVFDGSFVSMDGKAPIRTAIYTIDGHYMGTDVSKLVPGIYIHTSNNHGMVKTEKIIIR